MTSVASVTVYQAFPTPTPAAPAGPAPASVRRAVYLMYAGAVISLISGIIGVITFVTARQSFFPDTNTPGSPVSGAAVTGVTVVIAVFSIVIPILLWLWMAWKCKAARPWARIVSTVLFGLATVGTLTSLTGTSALGVAGEIASWLVGLGATILLWQRSSSWYFRSAARY